MRILTRWVVNFFSGGPYRFLVALVLGFSIIGFGLFHDAFIKPTPHTFMQECLLWGGFAVYFIGACWYAYLIYRGKWKTVWDYVKWSQDKTGNR
jgi:hypothetical protein